MQKSETLEIEMECKGVLLVATPSLLLAIDPARLTTRPEKDLKSQMPSPPVFKVLNMVANGFPYGMRFFVRESKLYLVGDEKSAEGVSMEQLYYEEDDIEVDSSFGTQGASPYIYVSDLTTPDSITDLFMGTSIYVKASKNYHSYNVNTKIWDSLGSKFSATPLLHPMQSCIHPAKIVPPYDDIFIGLHSATAFAVLIHSDGAVINMGEKEMCVIMAGKDRRTLYLA
eukprot:XP_019072908.1 PREDICTED: uncharacterized protein LOC109121843 isoform X2 [Vitis vinifera]